MGTRMFRARSVSDGAALLVLGLIPGGGAAMAQPPSFLDQCIELHELWARYESNPAFHGGQKARADFALECDCLQGRYARGLEQLRKMLRRGLVPLPGDDRPAVTAPPSDRAAPGESWRI